MTLPSSDSYITYGGEITNYSEVEDPNTDLDQEQSNSLRASAAAISGTCFRAILSFYVDGSNVLQIKSLNAVWNVAASSAPELTYVSVGYYHIRFPVSVIDLRGNTQYLNLLGGLANPDCYNGNGYFSTVETVNNTEFSVFNYSAIDQMRKDTGNTSDFSFTLYVR